ncbi:MAG: Ig-like domain-containing protein [Candidatus Competibacteraceae bacterium]
MLSKAWAIVLVIGLVIVGCKVEPAAEGGGSSQQGPLAADDGSADSPNTTEEDTPVTIAVLANDSDPGGGTLTVKKTLYQDPAHGTVTVNSDQTVTYTPNKSYHGLDIFTYLITNGQIETKADVYIKVNERPKIEPIDDMTIAEDSKNVLITFTIGGVTDHPFSKLDVKATSDNQKLIPDANLVLGGSGGNRTLTVTPAADENGKAVITVSATFTIDVTPTPDPAVVTGDTTGSVVEDDNTKRIATGKLNVTDPDSGEAGFQVQSKTSDYGTFSIDAIGNWTYTLNNDSNAVQDLKEGETRTDSFAVLTIDGTPTVVTLTITGRNEAPVIGSQLVTNGSFERPSIARGTVIQSNNIPGWTRSATSRGIAIEIQNNVAGSPYQGDQFVELDSNHVTAIYQDLATTPGATYLLSFAFSPRPGVLENIMTISWGGSGVDTLTVDGTRVSTTDWNEHTYSLRAVGTSMRLQFDNLTERSNSVGSYLDAVSVTATPDHSNTPLIADQIIAVNGTTGPIAFTIDDRDTPVDTLTVTATSDNQALIPDANLTVVGSGRNWTITATPVANQTGRATITVKVSDGTDTTIKTFVVDVREIGSPPTLSSIANQTINEDEIAGPIAFTIGDRETPPEALQITASSNNRGLIPDTDPDTNLVLGGSGANRTITATPLPNASGSTNISINVSDGLNTVSSSFTVMVNSVPDPAVVTGDTTGNVVEDTTLTATGRLNVTDPDTGESGFQVQSNTLGSYGTFSIDAGGTWTYTLNNELPDVQALPEGETRTDIFQVSTIDGTATPVTLTITGVNDAPAIVAQLVTNGGFELPDILPRTWGYYDSIPGWERDPSRPDDKIEIQDHFIGSPYQGEQLADLDAQRVTAIHQNLATTPGTTYLLSFVFSPHPRVLDNQLNVRWGSSPPRLISLSASGVGNTDTVWKKYSYTVTATGTVTRLSFDNLTETSDTQGSLLDDVSVIGFDGKATGNVVEDTTLTATGKLNVTDPDTDEARFRVQDNTPGTYGTFSIDAGGTWTYNLNNNSSNVQALREDEKKTDFRAGFEVLTIDGTTTTVTLTIIGRNDAPTITSIADQTIDEDNAAGPLPFTIGDVDTPVDILPVTVSSNNPTLIPSANLVLGGSGANRTLTVTPAANANGSAEITVTVSDGAATTSTAFTVTVTAINDAPTITPLANQTINEDTATNPLVFTIGDVDNRVDTLTVTASSSNPTLIPNTNLVLGGSGADRTIMATPVANAYGSAVITVSVSDGTTTTSTTFTVTVNSVNDPPVAQNDAYATNEDQTLTVPPRGVLSNDSDVENDPLRAVLIAVPAHGVVTLNRDGSFVYTPVINYNGPDNFTYQTSDGQANSNVATVSLTINPINDPPTITTIADQTIDEDTTTGPLAFMINDVDNPVGTLTVTPSSDNQTLIPNANLVLAGSGANRTITVTPAANANGRAVITLRVSDGSAITNITFTVTVNPVNDRPTITSIADQTIDEDTATGLLPFTISDVDNPVGTLTVTVNSNNPTLIPDTNLVLAGSGVNRTIMAIPVADANGSAAITVSVSDGSATTSTAFTVTVNAVNDLPTITSIGNQTIGQNSSTGLLPFTIGDVETAADDLKVTASSDDQTLIPNANLILAGSGNNRTIKVTPAPNQTGCANITVEVRDGIDTTSKKFKVFIQAFLVTPLGWSDWIQESGKEDGTNKSTFECSANQVMVGREHGDHRGNGKADENGDTRYKCATISNGGVAINLEPKDWSNWIQESGKEDGTNKSTFECSANQVMVGREHGDHRGNGKADENGDTRYKCATISFSYCGFAINLEPKDWSNWIQESGKEDGTNRSTFECSANQVMVGREHGDHRGNGKADENGDTRYKCATISASYPVTP